MTLFYSRTDDFVKDYIINSINLEKVVNESIKREFSSITNKKLNLLLNLALQIDSDEKWLGFIFQDYNLLDTLTLKENIALPLILSKKSLQEIEQTVTNVATELGIENFLGKYPYEVSGGQKQRASAAEPWSIHRRLFWQMNQRVPWIPNRQNLFRISRR